ncbi:guanitoxin biosynthesis heme-dependent pre-guanitoxin N-hydroxylase GntA [Novosphingobium sp. YAF33]|uniref:guanitoxin biosynthesis heme-dependent pre-guanitoxin N-hydroxylase GntA n=1 Tax=Novosphingobium sp. YAF33 TaxID=3233082 RepID=UPI003F95B6DA
MAFKSEEDSDVERRFRSFIESPQFPCVGAKSALAKGSLATAVCRSIASSWDDLVIYERLLDWSQDYREEPSLFRSLAFIFQDKEVFAEREFEKHLWERVQSLADKDAWLGVQHDESVSSDPENPHFSLSFGGEAFFIVGMHPGASRPARRFDCPVLVFNLHDQFVKLREQGKYEKMRAAILDRDLKLAGSMNPMLARHGETSEAAQYSGRSVSPAWQCPYRDPRNQ